jgi:small-conductance mechanosensitive channel
MDMMLKRILIPVVVAMVSTSALLAVRGVTFKLLHRWAERTKTGMDTLIMSPVKTSSFLWCVAIGLYSGLVVSELPERYIFYLSKTILVFVIFSITIAATRLSGNIFRNYIQKSNLSIPSTGLAYGLLKGTILIIGLLIILSVMGISITPLLTALGVGGLAVALALKDTLENLFAGIHILMEKSIRVGDVVKLETGQEGYVEDITWRTTRIKMISNNIVVIPNNKLAQSIVINFFLPDSTIVLQVPVPVSHDADIEKVERVLVEESKKAVGEVQGLLGEPEPMVRFMPGFGAQTLDFTLFCQVREFADQNPVNHALRKRILKRFREEGIEISSPTQFVCTERADG